MDALKSTRLFLLDMDGTIYLGDEIIPGATEFINGLKKAGIGYIYLTNNSSRSCSDYVNRLQSMGFPCGKENIFTSSMATAMYLNEFFPGRTIYPVGTRAFTRELEEYGVILGTENPAAVAVGFDTELTYEKLKNAVDFLMDGAAFIAANPDFVCPMPQGRVLPDCGSICALLTASTGKKPFYIGKPNRNMIDIISRKTGIPQNLIAVVGDRLYTDIAVAENAGAVSVCVLTGETSPEDIDASHVKPRYTFPSVRELGEYLGVI